MHRAGPTRQLVLAVPLQPRALGVRGTCIHQQECQNTRKNNVLGVVPLHANALTQRLDGHASIVIEPFRQSLRLAVLNLVHPVI